MSTGFPAVEATCRELGVEFDEWQQDLNRCILGKLRSGEYAADTVVMSIARQVGKTFDVGALVFADCIITPGSTTVWTAHRFAVARETFDELRGLATSPLLLPHIDPDAITSAAGNEAIPFRNGSRILFKARERGAIRGFTKVRRLILDEAQILTESAMSDMAPTMNQAVNPQLVLMGTPPKPNDPAEVFTGLRLDALEGSAEGVLYVEFSADPESDSDDRDAWRTANPSYPRRTSAKAIQRLRKLLSEDDFRREALGIWDSDVSTVVDMGVWSELQVAVGERPSPVVFGVEVSPSRKWASISVAGVLGDERVVQVVAADRGTGWVPDRLAKLVESWSPLAVALNPSGPAGALIPALGERGIEPELVTGRSWAQACGLFLSMVEERRLRHVGDELLRVSLEAARLKRSADAEVLVEPPSGVDVAPLKGVVVALFALERERVKEPERVAGKIHAFGRR